MTITGGLFILSPTILMLNFKCKEHASDDNAYWGIPLTFEALFKHKKVLLLFMIAFINSFVYFIILVLNRNNWKWPQHNWWLQFWILF